MRVQVDIGFDQLVQAARRLPISQWRKLKKVVEEDKSAEQEISDLESFLLTAPTFTKKQLEAMARTRKEINQWRKK